MQLLCLSISHHNTPVELRECLSLSSAVVSDVYPQHPIRIEPFAPILEMAILSTCNRLEVYALVSTPEEAGESSTLTFQPILNYLREAFDIPTSQIETYFKPYLGSQTVEHLFQVAAGLDSIAIGETQILGQVSRTLEDALRIGSARHVLSSLFRSAIHTGKRVHSETEIGRHPTNISAIAVQFARDSLGSLANQKVLVIGAGKMGGHAIDALKENGAQEIILTNRTYQHASDLVKQMGGSVLSFESLAEGLVNADLVFASTSAAMPIIHPDLVAEVMAQRPQKPLMLIDLAVPRNVEPMVKEIPNVKLFDIDDLQTYVKIAEVSSHPEIELAKSIVAGEVTDYEKLLQVIPFIGELHKKIEQIRQHEVERALRNLRNPDPQVSEQFELFSRALVRKILHEPTMHLRTESNQETLNDYVDTLTRLFDLSESTANISLQNGD